MVQQITTVRVRRIRIGGAIQVKPNNVIMSGDDERMQEILKSISNIDAEVAERQKLRSERVSVLFELMKTYRIPMLETTDLVANIVRPRGRSSSDIDVYKFKELVSEEDFLTCVKVMSTLAKDVLSTKELDSITDRTPGKVGPQELEITKKK